MDVLTKSAFSSNKLWQIAVVGVVTITVMRRILRRGYSMVSRKYSAEGKTVLITGANTGIGLAAAIEFAKKDARVILGCRNLKKAEDAVFKIRNETNKGMLVIKHLDLELQSSVKAFATDILKTEKKLDILINNAGVMGLPYFMTEDGVERTFAINHLGHFILTNMLIDLLKKSQDGRIIMVSSLLYKSGDIDFAKLSSKESFSSTKAYSDSKLANIMFANILSSKLKGSRVTVNSLSPGLVRTDLARQGLFNSWLKTILYHSLGHVMMRTPQHGAETIIYCSLDPSLNGVSGKFFRDCKEKALLPHALDQCKSLRLWEVCEQMSGTK